MTREEWDAQKGSAPDFVPWALATWRERLSLCAFYAVMYGVVTPALLLGIMWVVGSTIDGFALRNTEHDRCLKQATNGYEIKQCR